MKTNNISFPYPVLGVSDDILPILAEDCITVKTSRDALNYYFDVELKYDNPDIKKLIEENYAEYTCEIDCIKTLLRVSQPFKEPSFRVTVPRKSVNGRIDFRCYISVKQNIDNYVNSGFNEDYEGATFNLELGDILASFPSFYYDIDIKYDKLQAASSFMVIREGSNEITKYDFTGNRIEILLPPPLFKIYQNGVGNKFAEIIHSSMAYNALICALYNIDNHKETSWAKTILYRLSTEDELIKYAQEDPDGTITIEDIPELATLLLKDPYNRMLNYLNNFTPETEE